MHAKSDIILESYPSRLVLDLIADKWRPIVLYILGQGTKRYSELQRQLQACQKKCSLKRYAVWSTMDF